MRLHCANLQKKKHLRQRCRLCGLCACTYRAYVRGCSFCVRVVCGLFCGWGQGGTAESHVMANCSTHRSLEGVTCCDHQPLCYCLPPVRRDVTTMTLVASPGSLGKRHLAIDRELKSPQGLFDYVKLGAHSANDSIVQREANMSTLTVREFTGHLAWSLHFHCGIHWIRSGTLFFHPGKVWAPPVWECCLGGAGAPHGGLMALTLLMTALTTVQAVEGQGAQRHHSRRRLRGI